MPNERLNDILVGSAAPLPVVISARYQSVEKATAQSVTNSAVLVDDTALQLPYAANKKYEGEVIAPVTDTGDLSGLKIALTATVALLRIAYSALIASKVGVAVSPFPNENPAAASAAALTWTAAGIALATNPGLLIVKFTLASGATGGTLKFQFANQAAVALNATTIGAGAVMVLREVAVA